MKPLLYKDLFEKAKERFEKDREEYAIDEIVKLLKSIESKLFYAKHIEKDALKVNDDLTDLLTKEVGCPPPAKPH